MSADTTPHLDELAASPRPALLWDTDQARIVWANRAGLALWRAETLFDLLDRRFDRAEQGVAEAIRLAGLLGEHESETGEFAFPSSGLDAPISCRCLRHKLADGRHGLLMVAQEGARAQSHGPDGFAAARPVTAILDRIAFPLMLFDGDGAIRMRNEAAAMVFPTARTLAGIVGSQGDAEALLHKVAGSGLVSEVREVAAATGKRVHRVTASKLDAEAGLETDAGLVVLFDDITERRAHERQLSETSGRLEDLVAAAADFTFTLDRHLQVSELSDGFAALSGQDPQDIIGRHWLDLGFSADDGVMTALDAALAAHEPFRATLGWRGGAVELLWSAVALTGPDGDFAGYRGIGVKLRKAEGSLTLRARRLMAPEESDAFDAVAEALSRAAADERAGPDDAPAPAVSGPAPGKEEEPAAAEADAGDAAGGEDDAGSEDQASEEDVISAEERERASAETARKAAGKLVRKALNGLADGIVIHRDFDILYANRAAARALGFKSADALKSAGPLTGLFGKDAERLEKADAAAGKGARAKPADGLVLSARHGGQRARKIVLRAAAIDWIDGPARQVAITPAPKPRDDAGKRQTKALAATGRGRGGAGPERLAEDVRAILDASADGILTLDGRGRIETVNAGAAAIFGHDERQLTGKLITRFLRKDSARMVRDYMESLSSAGIGALLNDGREVYAVEKNGGEIPLFLTIARMEGPRKSAKRYCAFMRDITQWKKSEQDLLEAKAEADAANERKSEFLANISHELRTPLTAIIGFSEVMISERLGPLGTGKYRGYVTDILASGEHLLSLVNDLLDLSRVDAGKLVLEPGSLDLGAMAESCVGLMQPQAGHERIILRTSIGSELPEISADARSVRQIILNLLSNAIKYTGPGGQVIVSCAREKNNAVSLKVSDTGYGMSAEDIARALEPFGRVERPGGKDHVGTGLGLPLTKALAEANEARFEIESAPAKGTTVRVIFRPATAAA